jgi:hypothetical protein
MFELHIKPWSGYTGDVFLEHLAPDANWAPGAEPCTGVYGGDAENMEKLLALLGILGLNDD